MPHPASENDSSVISDDLFDLDLPEIKDGEGPLACPAPSFDLQMRHARFLLSTQPADFYEKRLASMNPEPFVLH